MLRKFPYPFRNMFTILSDTDCSEKDKFEGMHRFINTLSDCGNMGQGVGLDISDTFFMGLIGGDPSKDELRNGWFYWETNTGIEICASQMQKYIKAGWIDTPHTFFNFIDKNAYTKEQAVRVTEEWKRIGFHPIAWVDHYNCPWNIMFFKERYIVKPARQGDTAIYSDIPAAPGSRVIFPSTGEGATVNEIDVSSKPVMLLLDKPLENSYPVGEYITEHPDDPELGFREGAVRYSEYYCADLALQAGIKAFWTRIPSDISQKTSGGKKGFDTCLVPKRLPDNRMVWGLLRNYEYAQTNNTWLGKCIKRALYGDKFSSWKPMNRDTYMVISTHFGYGDCDGEWDNLKYTEDENVFALNGGKWFNDETIQAFRDLKTSQDNGEILVTRTSRLIKYNLAHDMLTKYANSAYGYTLDITEGFEKITIHRLNDDCFGAFIPSLEDLRGITFYCNDPNSAGIWITDKKIDSSQLQINNIDHTGKKSLGIKWHTPDQTDYSSVKSGITGVKEMSLENIEDKAKEQVPYTRIRIIDNYDYKGMYLDFENLKVENWNVEFDESGIPKFKFRWGTYYYPITIAHYGLENYNLMLSKDRNDGHKSTFIKIAKWLVKNQDKNGGLPCEFDYMFYKGRTDMLISPWYSALAQGMAMSVLTRAWHISRDTSYLESAVKATGLFKIPSSEGGVLASFDGYPFYEEYPTNPHSYILNGFMFSLLGLYDLHKTTGNPVAKKLYNEGIVSLKRMIGLYDLGNRTAYDLSHYNVNGAPPNVARWGYHSTHVLLITALNSIEHDQIFGQVAQRWIGYINGIPVKEN